MASITIDKDNNITGFCTGGFLQNGIDIPDEELPLDFIENWQAYRLKDKKLEFDEKLYEEVVSSRELENLRIQRQQECFSVINRGKLWYDTLTEKQYNELKIWYEEWLNITDNAKKSVNIPKKPEWLK